MANISTKRAAKAAKLRKHLAETIKQTYTAQRAGRDDAPTYDASGEADRNNTAQQHVANSQPIRDTADRIEAYRNRED